MSFTTGIPGFGVLPIPRETPVQEWTDLPARRGAGISMRCCSEKKDPFQSTEVTGG